MTHYAQDFGSLLPRIHKHPHANNIVNRELERRRLGELTHQCDAWIDKYWFSFYDIERGFVRTGNDSSRHYHATFANDKRC